MRPFVFINVAVTLDGKMDTFERKGAGISSEADKLRVHRLRAGADAVMVGGHTLLDEDPKLTVKYPDLRNERTSQGLPENPMKVGVVTRASIRPDGDFMTAGPARKVIFTTAQTSDQQIADLTSQGAEVFVLGEKNVDLTLSLEKLASLGVKKLMVEGGGTLNFELLRQGLVDELYVYLAPKIFGGHTAPTLAAGAGLIESSAIHAKFVSAQHLDDSGGLLLCYRL